MAFNVIISKPHKHPVPRFRAGHGRLARRWLDLPLSSMLFDKRFRQNRHGKHYSLTVMVLSNHTANYQPLSRRPQR